MDRAVLTAFLNLTVPLKIAELEQEGGPTDYQIAYMREHTVSEHADDLMFGSSKHQAELAKHLSDTLAVLAFTWGGVRAFDCHFVAKCAGNERYMTIRTVVDRLLDDADGDTAASRRAAQFLLSLWNGAQFKVDLQALLDADAQQFNDMQTVFKGLFGQKTQLEIYLDQQRVPRIIERWGKV